MSIRFRLTASFGSLVAALQMLSGASAAELRTEFPHAKTALTMMFLDGKITKADLLKVERAIEEAARTRPGSKVLLALHSPGSDHFIGLRIALLLQRQGVGTILLPQSYCASACSSIFSVALTLSP